MFRGPLRGAKYVSTFCDSLPTSNANATIVTSGHHETGVDPLPEALETKQFFPLFLALMLRFSAQAQACLANNYCIGPSVYLITMYLHRFQVRKITVFIQKRHAASSSNFSSTNSHVPSAQDGAPKNESVLEYVQDPKSDHRQELEKCLDEMQSSTQVVPIVINGKEYATDTVRYQRMPFDHEKKLAQFYYGSHDLIHKAAQAALEARRDWDKVSVDQRAAIFERAADLVSGKYRARLNAATMLGQGKTIKQAEIDSAAELADFFRFNSYYFKRLLDWQPTSTEFEKNSMEFRSLDGFVAAISPFNFTAIGGNLVGAPAIMGNCLVWKPSDTAVLSNYLILKLLQEAGLPAGVINFVPSEGLDFGRLITGNKRLAGINFTGSLTTFQWLWSEVGLNIKRYGSFPRLVGECGGKNFHLIHKSAHIDTAVVQTVRSAFEYSGQKCSACSRLYVSASLWNTVRDKLLDTVKGKLKVGPPTDFDTYTSAVIDENAFKRINNFIDYAKAIDEVKILCGGGTSDEIGYYVEPTIVETTGPKNRLMVEEIFGPILTVFVYQDADLDKTLDLIDDNPYALTGAIFAQDQSFIEYAQIRLRMAAGNLYINDKSTGAVVDQQPFGGARHSGTNDKAGGPFHLLRWCNQQTIKRTTRELVDI